MASTNPEYLGYTTEGVPWIPPKGPPLPASIIDDAGVAYINVAQPQPPDHVHVFKALHLADGCTVCGCPLQLPPPNTIGTPKRSG